MRSLGYVALAAVFAVACEKEGDRSAGSPPPAPTARDAAAAPAPSAPVPQPPGADASAPDEPAPKTPTTPAPKTPKPDPKPKPDPEPEPQGKECRSDADCTVVCVRAPCPAGVCNAGRCDTEPATSACATMLCKQGTRCVDDAKGARCVPMKKDDKAPCKPTGCSGSVCSDRDVMTTCEMRPEYACYRNATCARQRDGACGWKQTPELAKCLEAETSSDR